MQSHAYTSHSYYARKYNPPPHTHTHTNPSIVRYHSIPTHVLTISLVSYIIAPEWSTNCISYQSDVPNYTSQSSYPVGKPSSVTHTAFTQHSLPTTQPSHNTAIPQATHTAIPQATHTHNHSTRHTYRHSTSHTPQNTTGTHTSITT